MAEYYGAVVISARPEHPRDRTKVEVGVQVVEWWILAALRHRTFFSLAELNQAIRELLEKLNDAPFQKMEGSRRTLYETVEKAGLKPVPPQEFAQWKKARVNIDYHVEVEGNYYNVPHGLQGAGRGALHGQHSGDPAQGASRGQPRAQLRQGAV